MTHSPHMTRTTFRSSLLLALLMSLAGCAVGEPLDEDEEYGTTVDPDGAGGDSSGATGGSGGTTGGSGGTTGGSGGTTGGSGGTTGGSGGSGGAAEAIAEGGAGAETDTAGGTGGGAAGADSGWIPATGASTATGGGSAAPTGGAGSTVDIGTCLSLSGGETPEAGTTDAFCVVFETEPPSGWAVYRGDGRTITVGGAVVAPGGDLPGSAPYTLEFTAGTIASTVVAYW